MGSLRAIHLASITQLRTVGAAAWDDLWWRSDAALPTTRAEMVAQWVEQFRPRAAFRVAAIEEDGRWIAALPLVGARLGHLISAGQLPSNPWSPCGDLLLDPQANVAGALDLLLASASCLPWQILWLNDTTPGTMRWRAWLRAADRAKLPVIHHDRYCVGRVEIGRDWDEYQRLLRKSHRQNMNRVMRRLEREGQVHFERHSHLRVAEAAPWLRTIFSIENRSWKGAAGSSVLNTPDMFLFFVRQAEQLARWNQLEIATLRLNEQIVAFLYGFRAKGVYFAHKIGYDPQFAAFSPGQLLFYRLLQDLHEEGEMQAVDFMGPLTTSLTRWQPTPYTIGRIAMALRRPVGFAAMYAYKNWWPRLRQWKSAAGLAPAEPEAETPAAEPAFV